MVNMSLLFIFASIIKALSISLGVGASTVTLTHFFYAIADGTIDETERRMLGVAYVILRVAMVLILLATIVLLAFKFSTGSLVDMSTFELSGLVVISVLYINALLMTARLVPSTIGPALQAGSWYTLGILLTLQTLGLTTFTFLTFFMGYVTWLILAIGIVNAIMAVLKAKRNPS
jgi:hypothetical protein